MDRRKFFKQSGCGIMGIMLAHFGLKIPLRADEKEMCREDMVLKMLMEKKGLSEKEARVKIEEFKKKLPAVKEGCICRNCPSYVKEETNAGFCHPLVGKSKKITEKKGCICGSCPVYQKMKMKNGYYCVYGSEMEIEMKKE
jgi:hypothetical protein